MQNNMLEDFVSLEIGDKAEIVAIVGGDMAYRRKLLAMGIIPGVKIEMIRTSPLGDPIEIRVRGTLVSIRRKEAEIIKIKKL